MQKSKLIDQCVCWKCESVEIATKSDRKVTWKGSLLAERQTKSPERDRGYFFVFVWDFLHSSRSQSILESYCAAHSSLLFAYPRENRATLRVDISENHFYFVYVHEIIAVSSGDFCSSRIWNWIWNSPAITIEVNLKFQFSLISLFFTFCVFAFVLPPGKVAQSWNFLSCMVSRHRKLPQKSRHAYMHVVGKHKF